MEKKNLSNLNAALLLLLLLVIYTLIINFGGLQANTSLSWISYFIIVGGIFIFVIKYGKDSQHRLTFGSLFAYGFKTTAFLIIFYLAFTVLFYLLFPEYKNHLLEVMKQNTLKNATPENRADLEKGVEIFSKFFWPSIMGGILITFAILGAIGSLIGAASSKKEPNNFARDTNQTGQ